MPPELPCPFCEVIIPDWHFEWHSRQDQADIVAGDKAMECPVCGAGVAFDGFTLAKPDVSKPLARRDILQAARWAGNLRMNLGSYLKTREGLPYAKNWSNAEVESAERRAAEAVG